MFRSHMASDGQILKAQHTDKASEAEPPAKDVPVQSEDASEPSVAAEGGFVEPAAGADDVVPFGEDTFLFDHGRSFGMFDSTGDGMLSGMFGYADGGGDLLGYFESSLHAAVSSLELTLPEHNWALPSYSPLLSDETVSDYTPAPAGASSLFGITDPLFTSQWGLYNTTHPGVDINVVPTWDEFTGEGVVVGVIDDGVQTDHPDLFANYLSDHGYDSFYNINDPSPKTSLDNHGTNTSSVIAGALNGVGIVGVAYDSEFSMVRLDFDNQSGWEAMEVNALSHSAYADVINMSYGDSMFEFSDSVQSGLDDLSSNGRGGLGTILVEAVGNYRDIGDMWSFEFKAALPNIIGVGAIESDGSYVNYSNPGASLLVTAPGRSIWMADREAPNGYDPNADYISLSGTSFSAPMVTGVVALMLQANPGLGYRDVMNILAMTSGKAGDCVSDPDKPWDWQINGAENWNGGGMHVSHDYGFGLVNSYAAVRLAESWDQGVHTAANEATVSQSVTPSTVVPDGGFFSSDITIGSGFEVEYAQVEVTIFGGKAADLTLLLVSPDGTQSWLMDSCPDGWMEEGWTHTFNTSDSFSFGTNQCRGEDGQGTWTLSVQDAAGGASHTLDSWTLTLFGETPDNDDLYVFTDEFSTVSATDGSRSVLTDLAGTDTLNASTVTSASVIDLRPGTTSSVDGTYLDIAAGTVIENAHGGDGDDVITGNNVDNELFGWRGADSLSGGLGGDSLFGGAGADTLWGGSGSDFFRYESSGHGGDDVMDFSHADDAFAFDYSQFGQASAGTLAVGQFFTDLDDVTGSDACFIFEVDTLWYDADGVGTTDAVEIASVSGDDIQVDDITFV